MNTSTQITGKYMKLRENVSRTNYKQGNDISTSSRPRVYYIYFLHYDGNRTLERRTLERWTLERETVERWTLEREIATGWTLERQILIEILISFSHDMTRLA